MESDCRLLILSDNAICFQILEDLNLTMDQFIDLCILSGCDYCDSIRGIVIYGSALSFLG